MWQYFSFKCHSGHRKEKDRREKPSAVAVEAKRRGWEGSRGRRGRCRKDGQGRCACLRGQCSMVPVPSLDKLPMKKLQTMAGGMGSGCIKTGKRLPSFYIWHFETLSTQRMFSGFTFEWMSFPGGGGNVPFYSGALFASVSFYIMINCLGGCLLVYLDSSLILLYWWDIAESD